MTLKDMLGTTVKANLLVPTFSAINSAFTGTLSGLGNAANTLVGVSFVSNIIGKTKNKIKFF